MSSIKLHTGRIIELHSLKQSRTYENMLMGIPNKEINDRYIEALRQSSEKPAVLIPPAYHPVPLPPHMIEVLKFLGKAEKLPAIQCAGRFSSNPVVCGGEREDCSFLTLLWYQDTWALPIAPSVIELIKHVDWDGNAENWTY